MKKIKFKWNGRVVALAFASIALVMLLSVSYAYFISKVEGNEDAKATDITAGKMELEYDGTSIVGMENALPGDKKVITFTVRNKGTVTTQYNVDLINVTNEFLKDELVYSIKRNKEEAKGETPLPGSDTTLLEGVSIEKDETDTYELTIEFKETYSEQNYNQGKEFNGLIQINGYKPEYTKTILGVTYPVIQEEPNFKEGFPNEETSEEDIPKGSGLYKTEDEYGPSYIFRGQVDNNYVHFANQDWRILRVNGDGTIRLLKVEEISSNVYNEEVIIIGPEHHYEYVGFTFDGKPCPINAPCEVTYDKKLNQFTNQNGGTNSTIKNVLEEWYKTNLKDYDDQIAYGLFCNDISDGKIDDELYYGAYERTVVFAKPSLICPKQVDNEGQPRTYGGLYKTKIGLITVDELNMAGLVTYMFGDVYLPTEKNWLINFEYAYWTISPASKNRSGRLIYGQMFASWSSNFDFSSPSKDVISIIPVINLKIDNISYSGSGIEGNPIEIQIN